MQAHAFYTDLVCSEHYHTLATLFGY